MGVTVRFATSGIVGVTELTTSTVSGDATLSSANPEDSTSFALAVVLLANSTDATMGYRVMLPPPMDGSGNPNIKVGSVIKFKYLIPAVTAMGATQPVVIIDGNGSNIDGLSSNRDVDTPNFNFELIYFGGTLGWVAV